MWWVKVKALAGLARVLVSNLIPVLAVIFRSRTSLLAENLFLRKQLAFYLTDAARCSLVLWSRLFDWGSALVIVKPDTLIGWHRKGFQRFWRCKSRPGRPPLQGEIRELIVRMAKADPTWGQRRVAAERYLKLSILVSPSNRPQVLALAARRRPRNVRKQDLIDTSGLIARASAGRNTMLQS